MPYRFRSRLVARSVVAASAAAVLTCQQATSFAQQVPNVPPVQKPQVLERAEPLQDRPAPPG